MSVTDKLRHVDGAVSDEQRPKTAPPRQQHVGKIVPREQTGAVGRARGLDFNRVLYEVGE